MYTLNNSVFFCSVEHLHKNVKTLPIFKVSGKNQLIKQDHKNDRNLDTVTQTYFIVYCNARLQLMVHQIFLLRE